MPHLLFPTIDQSFVLKLRQVLNLSSKFNIKIIIANSVFRVPINMVIDDIRTRIPSPAMNVEQLKFVTYSNKGLWEHSLFLDALFLICHPNYLEIIQGNFERYLLKSLVKWMLEPKTRKECWPHLKDVNIQNPDTGESETINTYWIVLRINPYYMKFKLTWCSA